jgi:hypothetical protein
MAQVTIGGQAWTVTLPNFKKLKAAWRYIAAVQAAADPMASVEAILGVVSVGSVAAVTPDELEEALTPAEMPALRAFINELMVEIGLAAGEETPADPLAREAPSPSTATSTPSSAPSSPASEALTGMA